MLMMKRPSSPATPVRVRSLHSITITASASPSHARRDLDAVDAGELEVVLGRGIGVDDAHLLAERLERVGHRQLRADRVAVGPRVRGQQETLPAEDRVADLATDGVCSVAAASSFWLIVSAGSSSSAAGVGCRGRARPELLQDLLDPVVALDALVEEELQLRRAPQPQPAGRSGGAGTASPVRAPAPVLRAAFSSPSVV